MAATRSSLTNDHTDNTVSAELNAKTSEDPRKRKSKAPERQSQKPKKLNTAKKPKNSELSQNQYKNESVDEYDKPSDSSVKSESADIDLALESKELDKSDIETKSQKKHGAEVRKYRIHLCQHCGTEFKRKWDMDLHIRRMHSSKKCEKCEKVFKSVRCLIEHEKFVHNIQPSKFFTKQCTECEKLFQTEKQLQDHMVFHTEGNAVLFTCEICNKKLRHSGSLKFHIKACHGSDAEKIKKHSCDVCYKKYYFKNDLLRHLSTHSGAKPYSCELCDRSYRYPGNLAEHYKNVHEGVKYSCEACGKIFSSQLSFKRHSVKHLPGYNDMKFPCSDCGKSFCYKGDLQKHMSIHTGEKPFVCKTCEKPFRLKSHLKQHYVTHTGQKPFKCKFCAKGFSQLANVLCHERKQCKLKDSSVRNKAEQTDYDKTKDFLDVKNKDQLAKGMCQERKHTLKHRMTNKYLKITDSSEIKQELEEKTQSEQSESNSDLVFEVIFKSEYEQSKENAVVPADNVSTENRNGIGNVSQYNTMNFKKEVTDTVENIVDLIPEGNWTLMAEQEGDTIQEDNAGVCTVADVSTETKESNSTPQKYEMQNGNKSETMKENNPAATFVDVFVLTSENEFVCNNGKKQTNEHILENKALCDKLNSADRHSEEVIVPHMKVNVANRYDTKNTVKDLDNRAAPCYEKSGEATQSKNSVVNNCQENLGHNKSLDSNPVVENVMEMVYFANSTRIESENLLNKKTQNESFRRDQDTEILPCDKVNIPTRNTAENSVHSCEKVSSTNRNPIENAVETFDKVSLAKRNDVENAVLPSEKLTIISRNAIEDKEVCYDKMNLAGVTVEHELELIPGVNCILVTEDGKTNECENRNVCTTSNMKFACDSKNSNAVEQVEFSDPNISEWKIEKNTPSAQKIILTFVNSEKNMISEHTNLSKNNVTAIQTIPEADTCTSIINSEYITNTTFQQTYTCSGIRATPYYRTKGEVTLLRNSSVNQAEEELTNTDSLDSNPVIENIMETVNLENPATYESENLLDKVSNEMCQTDPVIENIMEVVPVINSSESGTNVLVPESCQLESCLN